MKPTVLLVALALLPGSVCVHAEPTSNPRAAIVSIPPPVATVARDYLPVSFETLAAYTIKVDWLINPTNSSLDTVQREGTIPDNIKSLHGKKVVLQGYLKPLQHDANGMRNFLLMRNHALCCQTNIPRINEWVHVRMTENSLPYAHESQFVVRGVLQVGEVLGAGNVVSVYRLTGEGITPVAAP